MLACFILSTLSKPLFRLRVSIIFLSVQKACAIVLLCAISLLYLNSDSENLLGNMEKREEGF